MTFKRRTGRTTRMLEEAVRLEQDGRAVYVIVSTRQEVKSIRSLLPEETSIKLETPGSLPSFDFETWHLMGAHPNCVVLVDHFVLEQRFRKILSEWVRFDAGKDVPRGDEDV